MIEILVEGTTFHFGRTKEELEHNPITVGPAQNLYFDPSLTIYAKPGKVNPKFEGKRFKLRCWTTGTPKFIISSDSITKIHIGPETIKTPDGYDITLIE